MEIYEVNLCIQSEYRKIQTKNNSVFGHFSRSACSILFSCYEHIVEVFIFDSLVSLHYSRRTYFSLGYSPDQNKNIRKRQSCFRRSVRKLIQYF